MSDKVAKPVAAAAVSVGETAPMGETTLMGETTSIRETTPMRETAPMGETALKANISAGEGASPKASAGGTATLSDPRPKGAAPLAESDPLDIAPLPPLPDLTTLSREGEEALAHALKSYEAQVHHHLREALERRVAPILREHQELQEKLATATVKEKMASAPEYRGFAHNLSRIESLIQKMTHLKSLPPEERYHLAYLIDRGQHQGADTPLSGAALVDALFADDAALRLFERRRVESALKGQKGETLPPFAPSIGGIPANVQKKPRNIVEAGRAARQFFGL